MSTTASEEQRGHLEPDVASASMSGWRRWASRIARAEQERLAGFGTIVVLGFLAGAAAVYGFTWLASEMLRNETNQMDSAAAAFAGHGRGRASGLAVRLRTYRGSGPCAARDPGLAAALGRGGAAGVGD